MENMGCKMLANGAGNNDIIDMITSLGFDFDKSNLMAVTIAIEKHIQYEETVRKYLLEWGIYINHGSMERKEFWLLFINDIAVTTSFAYLKYYDTLLQKQWIIAKKKEANIPIDAVKVNMMDMICYGEILATNLHEQITASLTAKGFEELQDISPEYREKLLHGFTEVEDDDKPAGFN